MLHSNCQIVRCLGSSRRFLTHDGLRYLGCNLDGYIPQSGNLLRCAGKQNYSLIHALDVEVEALLLINIQVFYSIGFSGIIYTVAVLAADVTTLRNRGLAFAFTSSPYMITAFAGSKAAEAFLLNVNNWRWGFGIFAIIVPAVTFPLFALLKIQLRKAKKQGLYQEEEKVRFSFQRFWEQVVSFDCESKT